MRRIVSLAALLVMVSVILGAAGCMSAPATSHHTATQTNAATPTATPAPAAPAGLLVFGSVGKRTFDQAGNATENYQTTLYDLNPQTGAILWKSPAYSGQAIQAPIVIGQRAIFAIGANLSNATTTRSGAVTLYAADLASGTIAPLTSLAHIDNYAGYHYDLSMLRLNATTIALTYVSVDSPTSATVALLAFTSSPDTPLWQANLPAETYPVTIGMTHDGIGALTFHRQTKTYAVMTFSAVDGHILRDASLPLVHAYNSSVIADNALILMSSTSTDGSGSWTIGGYSLQDGSAIWLKALGDTPLVTYGLADGLVLYLGGTAKGDALIATNADDGAQMWTTAIPGYAYVDGDGSHVYVTFSGQAAQISSFSSADGTTNWTHSWTGSADRSTGASEVTDYKGVVYFGVTAYDVNHDPTRPSTMYALAAADGSTVWQQTIPGWLRFPTETDRS